MAFETTTNSSSSFPATQQTTQVAQHQRTPSRDEKPRFGEETKLRDEEPSSSRSAVDYGDTGFKQTGTSTYQHQAYPSYSAGVSTSQSLSDSLPPASTGLSSSQPPAGGSADYDLSNAPAPYVSRVPTMSKILDSGYTPSNPSDAYDSRVREGYPTAQSGSWAASQVSPEFRKPSDAPMLSPHSEQGSTSYAYHAKYGSGPPPPSQYPTVSSYQSRFPDSVPQVVNSAYYPSQGPPYVSSMGQDNLSSSQTTAPGHAIGVTYHSQPGYPGPSSTSAPPDSGPTSVGWTQQYSSNSASSSYGVPTSGQRTSIMSPGSPMNNQLGAVPSSERDVAPPGARPSEHDGRHAILTGGSESPSFQPASYPPSSSRRPHPMDFHHHPHPHPYHQAGGQPVSTARTISGGTQSSETSSKPKAKRSNAGGPKNQPVFVHKLYNMLEDPEIRAMGLLNWSEDGAGFVCSDPIQFAKLVLPKWFKHNNWHSFVRQLNMYGFSKQVNDVFLTLTMPSTKPVAWEFRHATFRREDPEGVASIKRRSVKQTNQLRLQLQAEASARRAAQDGAHGRPHHHYVPGKGSSHSPLDQNPALRRASISPRQESPRYGSRPLGYDGPGHHSGFPPLGVPPDGRMMGGSGGGGMPAPMAYPPYGQSSYIMSSSIQPPSYRYSGPGGGHPGPIFPPLYQAPPPPPPPPSSSASAVSQFSGLQPPPFSGSDYGPPSSRLPGLAYDRAREGTGGGRSSYDMPAPMGMRRPDYYVEQGRDMHHEQGHKKNHLDVKHENGAVVGEATPSGQIGAQA